MKSSNGSIKQKGGFTLKIILNLMAMVAIGILLMWLGTVWLDSWTDHGEEVVVPDVKGIAYDRAVSLLRDEDIDAQIADSAYDNSSKPGTVVEQNPKAGSRIKNGRTVYLTINAFSVRSVTIPNLNDASLRQAQTILNGLGIKNITVVEVPSEFKNLVIAVKRDGRRLMAGARVPIDAKIVIEVGAGLPEMGDSIVVVATDSLAMEHLDLL